MGQPNFSGTFGNTASDIAGVGRRLIDDSRAEAEKKRAEALQASLAKLQFDKFGYEQKHDTDVATAGAAEHDLDNKRADAQLAESVRMHKDSELDRQARLDQATQNHADLEAFRAAGLGIRETGIGLREALLNRGQPVDIKGPDGIAHTKIFHPNSNVFDDVQLDEQGNPVVMGAGPGPTKPHIHAPGSVLPAPPAKTQIQPGKAAPTGAADHPASSPQPVEAAADAGNAGVGDTVVDAAGRTHVVHGEHASGKAGIATQPERDAMNNASNLTDAYAQYAQNVAALHGRAPSPAEYALIRTAFDTHPDDSGFVPVAKKMAAQMALQRLSPEWQTFVQSGKTLSNQLAVALHGKRANHQVYEAMDNMHIPPAGANPEQIAQMLDNVKNLVANRQHSISPRANPGGAATFDQMQQPKDYKAMADSAAATAPAAVNPEAKAYYDSLKRQGMSPDQALAETDKRYPR